MSSTTPEYNKSTSHRRYILESPSGDPRIQLKQVPNINDAKSPLIIYNKYQSIDSIESNHRNVWHLFSSEEKRNIFIYIIGIMLYKFGLEAFIGSIITLAANRFDRDGYHETFEKVGLVVGLNQACQCLGSILISPLIKRWSTRLVLSSSVFIFALTTAVLMIVDAATGGRIRPSNFHPMFENDYSYYGHYPTNIIIPIYCLTGITFGMVEVIRRVIPHDIVGSNQEKLQRMDALVHIFYELAGVAGAFTTGLVLIPRLGLFNEEQSCPSHSMTLFV